MRALISTARATSASRTCRDPMPAEGDVLVQVEVALTDGTDLKAYRRGHPVLLGRRRARSGTSSAGSTSRPGGAWSRPTPRRAASAPLCRRGQETLCESLLPLLNGAYAELPARA